MKIDWLLLFLLILFSCESSNQQEKTGDLSSNMPKKIKHNLAFTSQPDSAKVKGFQEVVFSVSDLESAIAFYQEATGWQLVYRDGAAGEVNQLWELAETVKIEEAVLRNPGDESGFLRLVKFDNCEQKQIRSSGRPWDTGGIFDINTRALDLAKSFDTFQRHGWNGFCDPVRFQFGKFDVSEVVMQGPDGIAIAMAERHAPPLEGYPNLTKLSHIFNSTHISKDVDLAYDFFINKLGFKVYLQVEGKNRKPGKNVLGIPQNINATIELPVYIVHPDGVNFGSVEFLQIKGLDGEDFAHLAKPPNLGILMLRFPVSDAQQYARQLQQKGLALNRPIQELFVAPYGKVKVFSVVSPDGVWMEFLEIL